MNDNVRPAPEFLLHFQGFRSMRFISQSGRTAAPHAEPLNQRHSGFHGVRRLHRCRREAVIELRPPIVFGADSLPPSQTRIQSVKPPCEQLFRDRQFSARDEDFGKIRISVKTIRESGFDQDYNPKVREFFF
jgi:hypothetical protein